MRRCYQQRILLINNFTCPTKNIRGLATPTDSRLCLHSPCFWQQSWQKHRVIVDCHDSRWHHSLLCSCSSRIEQLTRVEGDGASCRCVCCIGFCSRSDGSLLPSRTTTCDKCLTVCRGNEGGCIQLGFSWLGEGNVLTP